MSGGEIDIAHERAPTPVRRGLARLGHALFAIDEQRLSRPLSALLFAVRLAWLIGRGFFRERLQIRAAALSFSTLLAIVPAAALAFAIADALGATDLLITETIEPFMRETLGPADASSPPGVRALRSTLDGLLEMVRETHVAALGIGGLVVVIWSLWRVLRGIEESFEHIFQHRGPPRPFGRRLRAFLLVLLTTPIGLLYAVTSAIASHGTLAAQWLEAAIPFAPARELLRIVLPPIVVMLALQMLYLELPDAPVRPRSALLGAFCAALAWYGVQLAHVRFQVGLARYNAVYSGFGALPLLLVSIHVSWAIVLLGAQMVAAHQNTPTLRQLSRGRLRSHTEKQALAIRATVALARRREPVALRVLALELGVPAQSLRSVLDELSAHGLLRASVHRTDREYLLKVDPATLRASAVLDALEHAPGEPDLPWNENDEPLRILIQSRRAAASSIGVDRTIADLLQPAPAAESTAPQAEGTEEPGAEGKE